MKSIRLLLLIVPLILPATEQKKAPAPKPASSQGTQIPRDAKEIEPYTYRHTDAQGKTWIYRKTPFGVVRFPEQPADQAKPIEEAPESMTAVEEGDSLRFERVTPFGKVRWTRKKSELTEMERKAWERQRQQGRGSETPPTGVKE
jgi:hypothetical protein